jgi:hypothetical protein
MTQEVGSQKQKVQIQMWTEYEPWLCSDQRLGVRLIVEEKNTEIYWKENTCTLAWQMDSAP